MSTSKRYMVQCGDHMWAPGGMVCVHLLADPTREWYQVPAAWGGSPDGTEWLCSHCIDHFDELTPDDLVTKCLHCIWKLRGLDDAA
jgi:hypothetical protein